MKITAILLVLVVGISLSSCRPQETNNKMPMPYTFDWKIRDAEAEENGLFFEQTEAKNEETPDRVEGEYKVLMSDGRLMTVSYYVDGKSGFVPTITFEDNYIPDFEV